MTSLVNNNENNENTEQITNSDPEKIIRNKWKKVEQNLQKYNLNLVKCDKDGNCQFSAIENQLKKARKVKETKLSYTESLQKDYSLAFSPQYCEYQQNYHEDDLDVAISNGNRNNLRACIVNELKTNK